LFLFLWFLVCSCADDKFYGSPDKASKIGIVQTILGAARVEFCEFMVSMAQMGTSSASLGHQAI
jgi:hypothetical protein